MWREAVVRRRMCSCAHCRAAAAAAASAAAAHALDEHLNVARAALRVGVGLLRLLGRLGEDGLAQEAAGVAADGVLDLLLGLGVAKDDFAAPHERVRLRLAHGLLGPLVLLHRLDVQLAQPHVLRLVRLHALALRVGARQRLALALHRVEQALACAAARDDGVAGDARPHSTRARTRARRTCAPPRAAMCRLTALGFLARLLHLLLQQLGHAVELVWRKGGLRLARQRVHASCAMRGKGETGVARGVQPSKTVRCVRARICLRTGGRAHAVNRLLNGRLFRVERLEKLWADLVVILAHAGARLGVARRHQLLRPRAARLVRWRAAPQTRV